MTNERPGPRPRVDGARRVQVLATLLSGLLLALPAVADPFPRGAPLAFEGTGEGILVPGAHLAGSGDAVGAAVSLTHARLADLSLTSIAAALTWSDRVELAVAQPNLSAGRSDDSRQNIVSGRLRLAGSSRQPLRPALTVGANFRSQRDYGLKSSIDVDADRRRDWEAHLAASVGTSGPGDSAVLLRVGARYSRANSAGMLGFGGPRSSNHGWQAEGGVRLLVTEAIGVGAEYRQQPDNLDTREGDWWSAHAWYAPDVAVQWALGWMDLGRPGGIPRQSGPFLAVSGRF